MALGLTEGCKSIAIGIPSLMILIRRIPGRRSLTRLLVRLGRQILLKGCPGFRLQARIQVKL